MGAIERAEHDSFVHDTHIRPQHEFHIAGCEVFKQEDGFGTTFLDQLHDRIGVRLDSRGIRRHMESVAALNEPEIRSHMTTSQLERIQSFYRGDYECFGYECCNECA